MKGARGNGESSRAAASSGPLKASLRYGQPVAEVRGLPSYLPTASELDDDNVSLTTRTDDDPVRDAFCRVIDGPDDAYSSDGEQIVWQPRYDRRHQLNDSY